MNDNVKQTTATAGKSRSFPFASLKDDNVGRKGDVVSFLRTGVIRMTVIALNDTAASEIVR